MRVCGVVAAAAALGTLGMTGAGASAAVSGAAQPSRAHAGWSLTSSPTAAGAAGAVAPRPGSQLWAKRYNGRGNTDDGARFVAVSPDGRTVYVAGSSGTLAYDAVTGARRWIRNDPGVGGITSLVAGPGGRRVFLAGVAGAGYGVAACSAATGARLWSRHFGHDNADYRPVSAAVSPHGRTLFVTERSSAAFETIAFDVMTGARRWTSRYTGPSAGNTATSVAVSPTGTTVFVTGASDVSGGGDDYATVAYNARTGAQRWVTRYDGGGAQTDFSYSRVVSAGGGRVYAMFSIGLPKNTAGNHDAAAAYDAATGAQLWVRRNISSVLGFAQAIAASAAGDRVFVTGEGATAAYRGATGTRLWVRHDSGPGKSWDGASSVALSPTGNEVAVTGGSHGRNGYADYATVTYRAATGARLWASRYDGTGHKEDIALCVVFGKGRVFVTGRSFGRGSGDDYATIAYKN